MRATATSDLQGSVIGVIHAPGNGGSSPKELVIRQGGSSTLLGKVGLGDSWTTLGGLDGQIVVSGNRIADLTTAGVLWAKDGLNGTWYQEAVNVALRT